MNIVLRILVILTLILNGVAVWFATEMYGKRNLVIDRNVGFRDFTIKIAKTFEAEEPATENTAANHTARDISAVTLANADITPDRSDFWEGYQEGYEKSDAKLYQIPNTSDLDEVYILNAEGKPEKDFQGNPITDGAPMDKALDEVLAKAKAQLDRMNNIRGQLVKIREEYEDTVVELNDVKKQGRESLKTIAAKEEQIAVLESEKATLEGQVTELKGTVQTLEDEKVAIQGDLDKANEDLETAQAEVEKLKATLDKIAQQGTRGVNANAVAANVTAGVKGKVVRVDNDYNYCLVKLDETAVAELIGVDGEKELPEIEFYVRHEGAAEDMVVGKIRLKTLTKDAGVLVCDILVDWKQGDIKRGDEVFYLD